MRPGDRTDDVESIVDACHPVSHRLVERILEGTRTAGDRHDLGAKQLHAIYVGRLALDVLGAHVDHAFQSQPRRHGGRCHTVLAGAGFRDDPRLAHALGQQGLADSVVDLVRAGVIQILALEMDLRAAEFAAQTLCVIQRARTPHVVRQIRIEFGPEGRVLTQRRIGISQRLDGLHQGFGHETPAIRPEMTACVGILIPIDHVRHRLAHCRHVLPRS